VLSSTKRVLSTVVLGVLAAMGGQSAVKSPGGG